MAASWLHQLITARIFPTLSFHVLSAPLPQSLQSEGEARRDVRRGQRASLIGEENDEL
jgi:hypothetical protein